MNIVNSSESELGTDDEDKSGGLRYRVEGGTMFNSVVRLCVLHLQPALKKFLKQVLTYNYSWP